MLPPRKISRRLSVIFVKLKVADNRFYKNCAIRTYGRIATIPFNFVGKYEEHPDTSYESGSAVPDSRLRNHEKER